MNITYRHLTISQREVRDFRTLYPLYLQRCTEDSPAMCTIKDIDGLFFLGNCLWVEHGVAIGGAVSELSRFNMVYDA